jgi:membrane protein implicated in regulation of membrane protease activity
MANPNHPRKHLISAIAGGAAFVSAGMLLMSESRALQVIGAVIAVALVVAWMALPFLDARSMERHAEEYPELLKNEFIGRNVVAFGSFRLTGDLSEGHVILDGERWISRCQTDYSPSDGELLRVQSREGLTLVVVPQGQMQGQNEP